MSSEGLASVALGALGLYGLVAIVARSILQRRRTGSTGWRGIHGRFGSAEWFGGVAMAVAVVSMIAAPVVGLFGGGGVVPWWRIGVGAVLYLAGFGLTVLAQLQMGDAWRIGVQRGERTELRTAGSFGWCRNPIFTGMLLATAALAVWVPWATVALVALWVGLQLQVRVVEEPHLLEVHGEAYRRYAAATGRFLPGLGCGV